MQWISDTEASIDYVHDQWRAGFEVDAVHSFRWLGDNGVLAANHTVGDVRAFFSDSARRQGLRWY